MGWGGFPKPPPGSEPDPEAQAAEEARMERAALAALPKAPDLPADVEEILRDKVLQWRCKVFVDLGMTLEQARKLTLARHVDLNQARGMIAAGCDPHVAFDILS